ncbi:enoyl-CoA hydratase/isomerase family protein [uncultured Sphingomonas sp.]|uniref:enoyl-CoA hydratase/isomerase family protein n=1 Tax=uncultured Sphingomonas sp. TaxID=158754 RepID=UPI0035CC35A6
MSGSAEAAPLRFETDGPVAVLTLDRPKRGNSLSPDLLLALEAAWERVEHDGAIRVAIVTGAGTRHFCTGAEVQALRLGMGGLQNQPYEQANRFSPRMARVSKPVICAVNGLVNAGGLHFVADSDVVIACRDAAFMDSHVSVGQVSALESQGIARRAGVGAALLMGLAGRDYRLSAERAWMLGIVDLLEDSAADVLTRAMALARTMAANSPQAMALTKRAIWATTELPDPAAPVYGWELLKSQWAHPDFVEGPRAFEEERAPVWTVDPNARIAP